MPSITQGWPTWFPEPLYLAAKIITDCLHCGLSTSGSGFGLSVRRDPNSPWLPVSAATPSDRSQAHTDWSSIQHVLRGVAGGASQPVQHAGGELVQVLPGYWELRPPRLRGQIVGPGNRVEILTDQYASNRELGYASGPLATSRTIVEWSARRIGWNTRYTRSDRRPEWTCNSVVPVWAGWDVEAVDSLIVGDQVWRVDDLPVSTLEQPGHVHHATRESRYHLVLRDAGRLTVGWGPRPGAAVTVKFWRHGQQGERLLVSVIEDGPVLAIGSPLDVTLSVELDW